MDTSLQHDPKTKQQIKDALYEHLYGPALKKFKTRLDTLIVKNSVSLGNSETSFMYKGDIYQMDQTPLPRKMNRLIKILHPAMDEYLRELQKLNNYELPYVMGFINQVLNASNDPQDYLLILPQSLHYPVEKLIASCPCRNKKLTVEGIQDIQIRNQIPISLMKQRMVVNLLI